MLSIFVRESLVNISCYSVRVFVCLFVRIVLKVKFEEMEMYFERERIMFIF